MVAFFVLQWQMLGLSFFFNAVKTFCVFLAVAVFGGQCWRRDWLLYPNFNHLSWSFAFAVTAMALAAVASLCFYYVSRLFFSAGGAFRASTCGPSVQSPVRVVFDGTWSHFVCRPP